MLMKRLFCKGHVGKLLFAMAFSALCNVCFAQQSPDNWNRFRFEGNVTFTAEQLRSALLAEPDFLLANHPHSDNADVQAVTRKMLIAGYQNTGFHSATAQIITAENGDTAITIDEGPRFYCGAVRVTGAQRIDPAALADFLITPQSNATAFVTTLRTPERTTTKWIDAQGTPIVPESPKWQVGKPAPAVVDESLKIAIQEAFAAVGFAASTHRATIQRVAQSSQVELLIELADEGPQDRIESFNISGSAANSATEILAFLDLKPGCVYDSNLRRGLAKKLYDSGRFTKHLVNFERSDDANGRLSIELEDVPGIPPLSQPLSEHAEILMRSRQWMSDWDQHGEDLVCQWTGNQGKLQFVQSLRGTILQVESQATTELTDDLRPKSKQQDPKKRCTSLLIDSNELVISCGEMKSIWMADVSQFAGVIRLIFAVKASPNADEVGFTTFHVNWSTGRLQEEPLLVQSMNLTPAGWCAFAYKKNIQFEQIGESLVLTQDDLRVEIDIHSGRLIRFESDGVLAYLERGAFARMRESVIKHREDKPNAYVDSKPASSLMSFLASASQEDGLQDLIAFFGNGRWLTERSLHRGIAKMSSAGLFSPFDAFIDHGRQWGRTEWFMIPGDGSLPRDSNRVVIAMVGKFVLRFLPDLFAEDTWPMKVSREVCLVVLDRSRYTAAVIAELQADNTESPLRDASIAYLLSLVGQPNAKPFAGRALETMGPAAFDQDLKILLRGRCGRWITGVQAGIASLDDQEAESLTNLVRSESVKSMLQLLHTHAVSAGSQESIWYLATHQVLGAKLRDIILR